MRQDVPVLCGAQSRPTSRRRTELRDEQLNKFVECVCSDEMRETIEIIDDSLK